MVTNTYSTAGKLVQSERLVSVGTGVIITLSGLAGLFSNTLLAFTKIGIGVLLLDRGISGQCWIKASMKNSKSEEISPSDPAPLSTAEFNTQSVVIDAIDLGSGSAN